MKLQNSSVKGAPKPVTFAHFPLPVDNLERNVLVGSACFKSYDQRIFTFATRLKVKLRRFRFVKQFWVEDVELVALHNFRRRIIRVVVHLIVLVPFVALLYTVVITGFPCYI